MLHDGYSARAHAVIMAAFDLGQSSGVMGPLQLLVALSEDEGAAAALLRRAGATGGLRGIVFADVEPTGNGAMADYRARQVMGSAQRWAAADNTKVSAEHLLIALAEQAATDVVDACTTAGIDLTAARDRALQELGWPQLRVLEPLEPAGMMDRPPLPLGDLPEALWAQLVGRQQRLPLSRLRKEWQGHTLRMYEDRDARRILAGNGLNDDELYSLLRYHHDAVSALIGQAIPALAPPSVTESRGLFSTSITSHRHRRRFVRHYFHWLGGWACWFGNRRAGLRDRWFRLTWRY